MLPRFGAGVRRPGCRDPLPLRARQPLGGLRAAALLRSIKVNDRYYDRADGQVWQVPRFRGFWRRCRLDPGIWLTASMDPRGGALVDPALGEKLVQMFDELKRYPRRLRRGFDNPEGVSDVQVDTADGMDLVSFRVGGNRYTLRCADVFISSHHGDLRSARLGLFDEQGHQLFGGTVPEGGIEVLNAGAWVAELLGLHQRIGDFVRKRMIRDPYGLERVEESERDEG
jgi:hypothetical protein